MFLAQLVRTFSLSPMSQYPDEDISAIWLLVRRFPRGADFVRLFHDFDMGGRWYWVILPPDSAHYDAGYQIDLFTLTPAVLARDVMSRPADRLLSSQGLFPIAVDAVGSGDQYYINLADKADWNLYCAYSGEEPTQDMASVFDALHVAFDLTDPRVIMNVTASEEPP